MASYTGHGHHIPGEPELIRPKRRRLCGGPDYCLACEQDVLRAFDKRLMLFSNPAEVIPKKVSPSMSEPSSTPAVSNASNNVFNKAVRAIHELGHEMGAAEQVVIKLLKSGIVLRDVNEADKVVDEAAPVLEAAEPTLAPEVKDIRVLADKVTVDTTVASTDAEEFINEVQPTSPTS